jgi:Ring finger domain
MSECPICYEAINKDTGVSTLACSHSYHLKCIATWLSKNDSCPCCRKEVNEHEKLSAARDINIIGEEGYSEVDANVSETMLNLNATEALINRFLHEVVGAPPPPRDLVRVNARWNMLMNPEEEDVVQVLDSIIYGR